MMGIVRIGLLSGVLSLFSIKNKCFGQLIWESDTTISDAKDFKELRLDPDNALATVDNEIIQSIEFIFLETTRQSEFSTITQLNITEKGFIIFDENINAILFFDKKGKFKSKLTSPKDFRSIRGFSINTIEKSIAVDDVHSEYIYTFDLDGNLKKRIEKIHYGAKLAFHNGSKVEYFKFDSPFKSLDGAKRANLIIKGNKDTLERGHFWYTPKPMYESDIYETRNFYNSNNILLFSRELDNIIYEIKGDNILRKFKIVLPAQNSLPIDFLTNSIYDNKRIEYLRNNLNLSHHFDDVYFTDRYLVFSYLNNKSLLYDFKTENLYDMDEVTSLLKEKGLFEITGLKINALEDQTFISSLGFLDIRESLKGLTKSQKKDIVPAIQKITNLSYHNPTLILLNFKN
ncbi:6-bladed beta-propeller [Sphingobacterium multivorum]|uniref:6-bladed beta-propeller n=1 Tax=Sphingobacterium multivorum TaxID=28454 RepID=A0ABX7CT86_SPHMU|nr:6-bladed beta-propeller [Sphingobacterium multivorum]QQT55324.1 6-bladed beta-propeller [Sphingobacterium multivorum]